MSGIIEEYTSTFQGVLPPFIRMVKETIATSPGELVRKFVADVQVRCLLSVFERGSLCERERERVCV